MNINDVSEIDFDIVDDNNYTKEMKDILINENTEHSKINNKLTRKNDND
jgi:hypothetical protein